MKATILGMASGLSWMNGPADKARAALILNVPLKYLACLLNSAFSNGRAIRSFDGMSYWSWLSPSNCLERTAVMGFARDDCFAFSYFINCDNYINCSGPISSKSWNFANCSDAYSINFCFCSFFHLVINYNYWSKDSKVLNAWYLAISKVESVI